MAAGTNLRFHEVVALDWSQLVTDAGAVRHRVWLRAEDTRGNVAADIVLNEASGGRSPGTGRGAPDAATPSRATPA